MQTVWRITTAKFIDSAFTGEGARLFGGRWNPQGARMVYTAQSQSLALLELMVQDNTLRAHYMLIPAQLPSNLEETRIDTKQLPDNWRSIGAREALQRIGQTWLQSGETAVLNVPSAVVPAERNYLLNPLHPDFARIQFGQPQGLLTDTRLLRNLNQNM